jgi:hypothetical protein
MRALTGLLIMVIAMTTHADSDAPVLELRQYQIFSGQRDAMIAIFESKLIEGQEQVGMRLLGQFRDLDDVDRFTWMREFPSMDKRGKALEEFYTGAVWKAHRGEANPLLEDNDNVLLLRPATAELRLHAPSAATRAKFDATPTAAGLVVVTIYYLWKDPAEGFTGFFVDKLRPELASAGLPVLGAYVSEPTPNNFPKLPVRQHEKVFVWFTRVADAAAYEQARKALDGRLARAELIGQQLSRFQERQAQTLRLAPTSRSVLR